MEVLCPVCLISLKEKDLQGVSVDVCLRCHGVWLDRGELAKVVENLTADLLERQDSKQVQVHAQKLKSILEELFH